MVGRQGPAHDATRHGTFLLSGWGYPRGELASPSARSSAVRAWIAPAMSKASTTPLPIIVGRPAAGTPQCRARSASARLDWGVRPRAPWTVWVRHDRGLLSLIRGWITIPLREQ